MNAVAEFWKMGEAWLGLCWLVSVRTLAWPAVLEEECIALFHARQEIL